MFIAKLDNADNYPGLVITWLSMNEMQELTIVVLVTAAILLPFRNRIVPALRRALIAIQNSDRRTAIFIGLLDTVLLGAAAFTVLCLVSGRGPLSMMRVMLPDIVAYPLPCLIPMALLVIVGWRGTADARRIIDGRAGYLRPVVEGFLPCFMFPVIEFLGELIPIAYAGIPLYAEASSLSLVEWLTIVVHVLWESLKTGALGASLGGLLGIANRLTIKRIILKRPSVENGGPSF